MSEKIKMWWDDPESQLDDIIRLVKENTRPAPVAESQTLLKTPKANQTAKGVLLT